MTTLKLLQCELCSDYEYCAGHYGDDECTGFIPNTDAINEWMARR